jgi:hypothetical protein
MFVLHLFVIGSEGREMKHIFSHFKIFSSAVQSNWLLIC